MADTDRFVLNALEQSGCIPTEIKISDVKDITSEALVAIIWHCLERIKSSEPHLDIGVPTQLTASVGVAVRHRVGSQLANILKELGYAGDCGYNHFLYPNEKETRAMLSWLVSKLPRPEESHQNRDHPQKPVLPHRADVLADDSLADVFTAWTKRRTLYVLPNRNVSGLRGFERLPLHTHRLHLPWQADVDMMLFEDIPAYTSRVVSVLEALSVSQCGNAFSFDTLDTGYEDDVVAVTAFGGQLTDEVTPSLVNPARATETIEHNPDLLLPLFVSAASAIKENALAGVEFAGAATGEKVETVESFEQMARRNEHAARAQFDQIQTRLKEVQERMEELKVEADSDHHVLDRIRERVETSKAIATKLAKELTTRKQLLTLLPNAAENIAKLEALCAKNEGELKHLEDEWKAHKEPFEKEEQALMSMHSNRKARHRQLVVEMKAFRAEMKEMVPVIQQKMEELQALDQVYATLPRHLSRSSYTNRIMDIIKQVHKQKQEINKIIEDIKVVQKQLNTSSEKLKRTEAVTEDKIFSEATKQAASKDPNNPYVECYRKFAQVRELFEELILVTSDVGKKENTARDLENWITQLQGRDSSAQLEKVLKDLNSVRHENAVITEQLRALRSLPTL